MPKTNKTFLAGLIVPKVLESLETDSLSPLLMDLQACNALEIRYDLFEHSEWNNLSKKVRMYAPQAIQIGTIRLKRDGGMFPNSQITTRPNLWQNILEQTETPEWIDIERDSLNQYLIIKEFIQKKQIKILVSEHNFTHIPSDIELKSFANDLLYMKANGLKIAAMSNSNTDCDRLYKFIKKYSKNFELFAAFGMGEFGKVSRLWSLKEGANLTYASFDTPKAPGQIDVMTSNKALEIFNSIYSQADLYTFLNKFC